jgi:hypothetical protein
MCGFVMKPLNKSLKGVKADKAWKIFSDPQNGLQSDSGRTPSLPPNQRRDQQRRNQQRLTISANAKTNQE